MPLLSMLSLAWMAGAIYLAATRPFEFSLRYIVASVGLVIIGFGVVIKFLSEVGAKIGLVIEGPEFFGLLILTLLFCFFAAFTLLICVVVSSITER